MSKQRRGTSSDRGERAAPGCAARSRVDPAFVWDEDEAHAPAGGYLAEESGL